ncbi:DUF1049 domain-containing protein [Streptomyces sp. NBC_00996]|uniref:DUF1049 domain-containing protein n=1 Tax=Streptomyces sp. NBC_00996 TaxID=2903710 RepID=UPI0038682EE1|nr:DUF1049 domain-containing protein [Streptomyces sp. NBC_00996]
MSPKTTQSAGPSGGTRSGGQLTPGRVGVATLALLALIFVCENTRGTKIRLCIPEVTMPLWRALLGTGVIGGLCGAYAVKRRG